MKFLVRPWNGIPASHRTARRPGTFGTGTSAPRGVSCDEKEVHHARQPRRDRVA